MNEIPTPTRRAIAAEYASGRPMAAIRAKHNVSGDTVRRVAREYGIPVRAVGAPSQAAYRGGWALDGLIWRPTA